MSPRRLLQLLIAILISLQAASAQTCVAAPPGIIAWWTLDETSGIVAKDSVGTEPAAYFGTPPPNQTTGLVGDALKFNGSSDFLSAANSSLWAFGTKDFTVELWANFAVVPGGDLVHAGAIFIGDDDGPGLRNKWFFALGGGLLHFTVYNTAVPPPNFFLVRAPFVPVVGQWYHLAVTKTGTTFTIYVNGVAVGSEVSLSPIASPSAPLTIGQAESLGFMNGILDEISVYNRALSQAELQAIANAGSAGKCKLATASAIVPSAGGNAGQVSVTLSGSQFSSTSTVYLQKSGLPNINSSTPIVSSDSTSLSTTFDLTDQPLGVWDVVVSAPTLPNVILPQAFTIEPATPPGQVWANVVGRGAIRVGETQEFVLIYGNNSDTDAIDVPIWLAGIPTTATFTPQFTITLPPAVPGFSTIDPSSPITITTASDIEVPLLINRIPPGTVGALEFSLLVTDLTPIQLVTTVSPPAGSFVSANSRSSLTMASGESIISISNSMVMCGAEVVQLAMTKLGIDDPVKCGSATVSFVTTALGSLADKLAGVKNYLSLTENAVAWAQGAIACVKTVEDVVVPEAKLMLTMVGQSFQVQHTLLDCANAFRPTYQGILNIIPVRSFDPNAKQGLQGAGTLQYLAGSASWPYTISFENKATATAPAQSVTITDQLDTAHLDLSTFSLGPIGFGSQQIVPPPGLAQFSSYVDLRPATSLIVGVNASLNKTTGIVTWSFNSLDPSTGEAPTDPLIGFLPPDTLPPQGDGQVLFSVSPKTSVSTGQQISNGAFVVFDANPPISTPTWFNTVDNSAPVSHVLPLPTDEASQDFIVQWTGTDVGSGIANFAVFVSDNGGPFTAFQTNTTATSATFNGTMGHTYGFYSIARDLVGNVEAAKSAAEATTQVTTDTTPPVTIAAVSPGPNANGWNNTNVTVTLNSTDSEPGGTGVKQITYSATGAQTIASTVVNGASASFTINTEGITTISFFGTDNAGNVESAHKLTIQLDKTPPTVTCATSPNVLWPPDNKLVPINISVKVSDSLSGPAGFTLVSVTSNEPDSSQDDIQGFVTGTASSSGQLRAQRLGSGTGRVYTFTHSGADRAGNTSSCTTTVTVPHDQGQN